MSIRKEVEAERRRRLELNTGLAWAELAPGAIVRRVAVKVAGLPGLHLTVQPAGAITWSLRYTVAATGARQNLRIGDAFGMDREMAIDRARKLRDQAGQGVDLKAKRAVEKATHLAELARIRATQSTVGDVLNAYLAELRRKKAPSLRFVQALVTPPTESTLQRREATAVQLKPILKYLAMAVAQFDKVKAADVLDGYSQRWSHSGCVRVLGVYAAAWRFVLADPKLANTLAVLVNPWADLRVKADANINDDDDDDEGSAKGPATRALQPVEFAKLVAMWNGAAPTVTTARGDVVEAPRDRRLMLAAMLIAYSGQRVSQCLRVRPEHLQLDGPAPTWTIPFVERKRRAKLKGKEKDQRLPHVVALNSHAVAVLREALALHQADGQRVKWLFPRIDREGKVLNEARTAPSLTAFCQREAQRVGIERFDGRDLRRSWASWSAGMLAPTETEQEHAKKSGQRLVTEVYPFHVREQQMDHALPGMAAHYDYSDPIGQAHEAGERFAARWSDFSEKFMPGNVRYLRKNAQAA